MQYLIAYVAVGLVFFVADFIWLGTVAKDFYREQLAGHIAENFHIGAAVGFYLMYIAGIVFFAVRPALASGQWSAALVHGALFGFFCYATYNMTNWATLRDWPVKMSLVDMPWGTFMTAIAALGGYAAARWLG
ncbi:MAG: DUF2177 family protein [Pseudomonadota bacterium]